MPRNVRGQRLRLLAAALAMNAINWQYHLQAHGEPNIFDNTEKHPRTRPTASATKPRRLQAYPNTESEPSNTPTGTIHEIDAA